MTVRNLAAYVFLAIVWGFSFLVLLKAVQAFGWIGAVTLRAFVAGATLLVVTAVMRRKLDFSAGWQPFAVVGATTVAGQLVGLSYATPVIGTAMAAIIVAAIPLFSMVISQVWGIERVTRQRLAGILIGLFGIVLLVGFPAEPVTRAFVLGCAAAILGSFCAAFGSNYASHRLGRTGSLEVTTGAFLFGGLLSLPLLLAVPFPGVPRAIDYGYLVVLGVLMSALPYVVYFRLVAAIGPTRAISVEFVVTVVAVLVGAIVLGERLTLVQVAGAFVILCGCLLVLGLVPQGRAPVTETDPKTPPQV